MRIKRTDKNFTVRKKGERQIRYAGKKKSTENAAGFSTKEKQDMLRQKELPGGGAGRQAAQIQRSCDSDSGRGEAYAGGTGDLYQQEQGKNSVSGSRSLAASGILHVKEQPQAYRQEPVFDRKLPTAEESPFRQETQRPSSYHETIIKTKETVLHRKADTAPGFSRKGIFSVKDHLKRMPEKSSARDKKNTLPASVYAQPFPEKRENRISGYRRGKYLKSRKQHQKGNEVQEKSDTGRKETGKGAGAERMQKAYLEEGVQLPVMQNTAGESILPKAGSSPGSASHLRIRNASDSIRQRGGEIPGRKGADGADGRRGKSSEKDSKKGKNTKKDNSHKPNGRSRKNRAAAFRLLSYAADKFSQEEQKDSLLQVAKDLLTGRVKAVAAGKLLSIGASLLPALVPVFVMAAAITLLFNSPFSILLPKLSEEPGAVEVLSEYTEEFREKVQEELADSGSGDETELIYEDYEGDSKPDNMADILMVYMVRHGFGDTATVMTEKNRRLLKDTFDEMTSLTIDYRTEIREQPYEEEDFWGNVTIKTEEVEVKIKEVRITLLTSEDIVRTGIFTEDEIEILRFLMSPEVLENIEGLRGGYGSPGAGSLTPEEAGRLNLGGDVGSQAVKNALVRLGKPYSQAKRDSGEYYDCSSLTFYSYKEAGINLSYHGSNTAASQGKLLSDKGCEVAYEDIRPGDLIFYSFTRNGRYQNISHVAVYAGNGYLVDASSSKGCVVFRPVYSVGKIVLCGRPSWL
ncbi:peptidoglycan DL-endopeptidase CwlO [Lachnospiraceae bacterium]|nr:peptidoglycan DL-endopeptidase CwlO [Lachnospiraceae bacterium]